MENLVGNVYSDLTVISFHHQDKKKNSYWLCKCVCGKEKIVRGTHLKNGGVKSCGCKIYKNNCSSKTTWFSKRLRKIWNCMNQRCYNPNNEHYKYYGARGIFICEEWKNNSQLFNDWSVSNGYEKHLEIDRIDNNKEYSPENCKWSTREQQMNNTRRTRLFTINNKMYSIKEISENFNIDLSLLRSRLNKGWNIERAINEEKH